MLGPHLTALLGPPMAVVLPRPRGGVAPPRHEVALAEYIEKQSAHRQPRAPNGARVGTALWNLILGVGRAAIPMLVHAIRAAPRAGLGRGPAVSRPRSAVSGSVYGR